MIRMQNQKPELLGFKYSYTMENIRIGVCGKTDKKRLSYLEPNRRAYNHRTHTQNATYNKPKTSSMIIKKEGWRKLKALCS